MNAFLKSKAEKQKVTEKQTTVLEILIQKRGEAPQPIGYFSKQLGPACFQVVATTNLLVEVGNELTVEQLLKVQTPHQVQGVLVIKGLHGLTGDYIIRYQALLLDFPELTLKICHTLNPATLMPAKS